jgi:hypothetical protein
VSIIKALSISPITRLRRIWEPSAEKTLNELSKLMDREMNYSMYVATIHSVSLPCLPYLGICDYIGSNLDFHISRLQFLNDDNPDTLENNEVINFSKRMKIAKALQELQSYQTVSYPFRSIEWLQSWITHEIHNSAEMNENNLNGLHEMSEGLDPGTAEEPI